MDIWFDWGSMLHLPVVDKMSFRVTTVLSSQFRRPLKSRIFSSNTFVFPVQFLRYLPERDRLHAYTFLVSLLSSMHLILFLYLRMLNLIVMEKGIHPVSPTSPVMGHTFPTPRRNLIALYWIPRIRLFSVCPQMHALHIIIGCINWLKRYVYVRVRVEPSTYSCSMINLGSASPLEAFLCTSRNARSHLRCSVRTRPKY